MPTSTIQITRLHQDYTDTVALEGTTENGTRVTIWPGVPANVSMSDHPSVSRFLGVSMLDGKPVWVEHRPGPWALADLERKVGEAEALELAAQLADGLASLHGHGLSHGGVDEQAVVLHSDGRPCLIGTGRLDGSPEDDLRDCIALLNRIAPEPIELEEPLNAPMLSAKLRELIIERDLPASELAQWLNLQGRPVPSEQRTISLELAPLGSMDEVLPDIGLDPPGKGLLDRWGWSDTNDEQTDDPTETADLASTHTHARQQLLDRMERYFDSALGRYQANYQPPGSAFRTLVLNEPLDPIPLQNGLAHGSIHNPQDESESTAEVPSPELTNPSVEFTDETTGTTGDVSTPPIQASVITGLLMATVLGMIGAAFMLIAVWLILGDVF
jgi:serine/threonine protein kinase